MKINDIIKLLKRGLMYMGFLPIALFLGISLLTFFIIVASIAFVSLVLIITGLILMCTSKHKEFKSQRVKRTIGCILFAFGIGIVLAFAFLIFVLWILTLIL